MAWFFKFEESTTLKTVREKFSDESWCEKFVGEFRKSGKFEVGVFDTTIAILFGGYDDNELYRKNYIKKAVNGNITTWTQNIGICTAGERKDISSKIKICEKFGEADTLKTVSDELEKNWKAEKNKEKVLACLRGSNIDSNQSGKVGSNEMNKDILKIVSDAIDNNKQVIFTGAPGTGKTWAVREWAKERCAILNENGEKQYTLSNDKDGNQKKELIVDNKQYKFVQFHPSYDYSDFVEGLRPVVIKGKEEPTFVRMDGVFKEFCRHIVNENNKDKKFYFIVDEINRADLAKVFGELMFGLEESYRGKENPIQTQYKNLTTYRIITKNDSPSSKDNIGKAEPIEDDVFMDGFYIPKNLYFIGTMNDIDRSVDSMDFALRRRFQWINVKANEIMRGSLHSILDKKCNEDEKDKIDGLAGNIKSMNEKISDKKEFGLSEAYHIGPAYFKELDMKDMNNSLKEIFDTNISSILREYTRGRKSEDVENWIGACRAALLGGENGK